MTAILLVRVVLNKVCSVQMIQLIKHICVFLNKSELDLDFQIHQFKCGNLVNVFALLELMFLEKPAHQPMEDTLWQSQPSI